jgi:uncharacterized membrane protein YfcA
MNLFFLAELLTLGVFAGFLSGLLGIGGGSIIVPALTHWFDQNQLSDQYVKMAIATAMGTLFFTCISSTYAHHRKKSVRWDVVYQFVPGVAMGSFLVAKFLFPIIPKQILAILFTIFIGLTAFQLLSNKTPPASRGLPSRISLFSVALLIGSVSSLLGVGGGLFAVPFLIWCNVSAKQAIGTATAISLPTSLLASLGFIWSGWNQNLPAYSLGYIYLPALLVIASSSVLLAPLGAKLAHQLPTKTLKKIFALFLLILTVYMGYQAVSLS